MAVRHQAATRLHGDTTLERLRELLVERIGLSVPDRDVARLVGIMDAQIRAGRLRDRHDYLDRLARSSDATGPEWAGLIAKLTVPESFFNRDPGQLDVIEHELLPAIMKRNAASRTIRLWSAGCSTGEEAYSLAMIVQRVLAGEAGWQVLILATDLNPGYLDRATAGVFGEWSFRRMTEAQRGQWFTSVPDGWLIDERLRQMVTFHRLNLVADAYPDTTIRDMDLILCRNVFIYFDRATTESVVGRLVASLRPDGYLMTGHTELVGLRLSGVRTRTFATAMAHQRSILEPEPVRAVPMLERRHHIRPIGHRDAAEGALPGGPVAPVVVEPADFEAWMARGYEAANTGDLGRAREAAHRAARLVEFAPEPYLLEATVAELEGDDALARRLLDKALYLDPTCVPAYLTLAELHEATGNLGRAQALRERAQSLIEREGA